MTSRIALTAVILLSLLYASAAWSGTIYRWVDAEGNVQFSENPPPGQASEETGFRTGSGSSSQTPRAVNRTEQERETTATDGEPQAAGSEEGPDNEELARHHQRNCETARANLRNIQNHARIQVEENGERRYLSPEEIEERRLQSEQIKAESCNWSPD